MTTVYLITDGSDNDFVLSAARKAIQGVKFEIVAMNASEVESWSKGRNGTFVTTAQEAKNVDVPILRECDIPDDCWA